MSDEESVTYKMLMPFVDQSVSFVHGFEIGKLYYQMEAKEPLDLTVHSANVEQLLLMADLHGYCVEFETFGLDLDPDGTYRRMIGAPGERKH